LIVIGGYKGIINMNCENDFGCCAVGSVQFVYLLPTKERKKEQSSFKKMKGKWNAPGLFLLDVCVCMLGLCR
jgi:hypothetical protein